MDYKNTYESNIKEYTVTELSNALKETLEGLILSILKRSFWLNNSCLWTCVSFIKR